MWVCEFGGKFDCSRELREKDEAERVGDLWIESGRESVFLSFGEDENTKNPSSNPL